MYALSSTYEDVKMSKNKSTVDTFFLIIKPFYLLLFFTLHFVSRQATIFVASSSSFLDSFAFGLYFFLVFNSSCIINSHIKMTTWNIFYALDIYWRIKINKKNLLISKIFNFMRMYLGGNFQRNLIILYCYFRISNYDFLLIWNILLKHKLIFQDKNSIDLIKVRLKSQRNNLSAWLHKLVHFQTPFYILAY